jgi:NAD(P)-dependent dehydrogenase (short-subunit alcohol dehydrogenase family)
LTGSFLCSRAVCPYFKAQGGGKIINVASSQFFRGAANYAHYVTSKGGIIGLTRSLARELGQFKINVNCIAPGGTLTDPENPALVEMYKGPIPRRSIPRIEYPEDLVGTAVFLASSDSDFITGHTIVVDGGDVMI